MWTTQYISEISDLLACPFCGGKAHYDELKVWPWSKLEYMAKCRICGIHGPGEWTTDKAQAAQDWNTRHANDQGERRSKERDSK